MSPPCPHHVPTMPLTARCLCPNCSSPCHTPSGFSWLVAWRFSSIAHGWRWQAFSLLPRNHVRGVSPSALRCESPSLFLSLPDLSGPSSGLHPGPWFPESQLLLPPFPKASKLTPYPPATLTSVGFSSMFLRPLRCVTSKLHT